ncbi:RabGAP/TBC [Anaeromyces robustus]|uniref:RabGAP/TBC n=1 Tax=Anaeromyces robustus TaxID=1754192 RepID=A0A1Y1X0Q8_9FUNG|nr:RabGAP/TBC [Anaeromyces robustus]|eukprot:ORX78996.1 RabGAP/TBC [Anaeromyces robustus]
MNIVDEDLVDVDLDDDSDYEDANQIDNYENINDNDCFFEIPLVEHSNIPFEVKDEDNIDYDKYGFKKSYKYIPKVRQEEYENYYQRILERREQKWNVLLEECNGEFPPMSSKLKRYIRKGIPGYIRSLCWFYYSGAKTEMENNPGLYEKLLNYERNERNKGLTKKDSTGLDCVYAVEKDLFRTFPDNKYFAVSESILTMNDNEENSTLPNKKFYINPYIGSLRNILVAFVYYSLPKSENGYEGTCYTIGYCQSLNYIAGLLLLIFAQSNEKMFKNNPTSIEEMCFWMFATLIDKILPKEMYGVNDMEGAVIEQELLWNLIIDENGRKFGVRKVAKWKKDMEKKNNIMNGMDDVPETHNLTKLGILTFKWMTTCFVGILPIETVLRIWDCVFAEEGYITILRVTLTLLRIYENDISKNDDELEGWDFINIYGDLF